MPAADQICRDGDADEAGNGGTPMSLERKGIWRVAARLLTAERRRDGGMTMATQQSYCSLQREDDGEFGDEGTMETVLGLGGGGFFFK
ncbi:unnamed protein product [Linum trigynum]|uniref:Uncharacterized protein n=1 Tax=Linum trigynum TaxID=586398 RepID=A0AAV2CW99_9ROSI